MFEVVGVENVVGGLNAVADNLGRARMTETMHRVNDALTSYHATMYGKGRQDLPQTLVRHPDSDGRLVETGKLRDSLTLPEAPGAVRMAGPTGQVWGTDVPYAGFAAYGTPHERRRPLVRFNAATKAIIRETIYSSIFRGAEGLLERGD